jgi:hypothetical protein
MKNKKNQLKTLFVCLFPEATEEHRLEVSHLKNCQYLGKYRVLYGPRRQTGDLYQVNYISQHRLISDLKLSMELTKHFKVADKFNGFTKAKKAA